LKNIINSISKERIAWCALLIILVLTGIIRYGLLNVPLERDEGEYAYTGQLILQGISPFQEVYNMKFPGIYAAYALFLAMFGQSHQGIHTALLIINAITIITVFLLAKHIANLFCAIISAASFALLSVSQPVQGVFANAEHFVIVFATGGLFLMLRGLATASLFRLFAAGLLLGLGFVMKQHGFAFSVLAALYMVFDLLRQRPIIWRGQALRLLSFTGGMLIVFGSLCLIMAWTGVFRTFWFWTFDYASTYISQVPLGQAWQGFITTFTAIVHSAPLLWILVGFGFLTIWTKSIAKHHRVFLLMYAIFSALSICPGFYFRPHYFVLLLPCASLFVGVTISVFADFLSRFSSKKIQYGVPIFLIALCLFQSIYKQRDFIFHMTPFQISRVTYWLNPFQESLEIADFIRNRTRPEDRIALLGSEPQIFFYSQRRSASSYIYMYPLMENHDFALQMQKDFIKDVEEINPKYLIFVNVPTSWLRRPDSHKDIFQWFDSYLQRGHLRLVGVVELWKDETVYHWEPDVKWPVPSQCWIAIFERTA
jgi:hypothetical protein